MSFPIVSSLNFKSFKNKIVMVLASRLTTSFPASPRGPRAFRVSQGRTVGVSGPGFSLWEGGKAASLAGERKPHKLGALVQNPCTGAYLELGMVLVTRGTKAWLLADPQRDGEGCK